MNAPTLPTEVSTIPLQLTQASHRVYGYGYDAAREVLATCPAPNQALSPADLDLQRQAAEAFAGSTNWSPLR